jgi:hypothetical protein
VAGTPDSTSSQPAGTARLSPHRAQQPTTTAYFRRWRSNSLKCLAVHTRQGCRLLGLQSSHLHAFWQHARTGGTHEQLGRMGGKAKHILVPLLAH